MICISGDWYVLHGSTDCDKGNSNTPSNVIDVEFKTEAADYTQEDAVSLKSETNDYDSDDTRGDNIFEQSPVHFQSRIEVSSLPEIVIPPHVKQREIKKEPIRTQVGQSKRPRNISKPICKIETVTENTTDIATKPMRRNRKKVIYKATFLDHRPKASCICDVCNKTLGTFSSLRNHILNMHCESERSERVSCDECGQTFSTPGNLNSHKKIHLKCKAYVCT